MSNKQQYDDNMMGQQTSNDGQSINNVNNLTSGQAILNNHNTQSDHQDERYFLRWNDFTKNVSLEFERLREDEDLVDITFACDGRKIGAHKLVLFASSQYFKNILKVCYFYFIKLNYNNILLLFSFCVCNFYLIHF